jgi:hypothetical protein
VGCLYDAEPVDLGDAKLALGRALFVTNGDRARATQLASEAADAYASGGNSRSGATRACRALLAQLRAGAAK